MAQNPRYIDPDRLWQANKDLVNLIERDGVDVVYDSTLDTLFVEFGGPKEALSEHAVDNIMIRIDPDTLRMVGFEILDFFSDFLPHNRLFQAAVQDLGLREGMDSRVTLTETRYREHVDWLEGSCRQLVHSAGAQS